MSAKYAECVTLRGSCMADAAMPIVNENGVTKPYAAIRDGDMLLVQYADVPDGGTAVLCVGKTLYVRRVHRVDCDHVILLDDNFNGETIVMTSAELRGSLVGRVVGIQRDIA